VREETNVVIDAASVTLLDAVSTEPRPNRNLMFASCAPVEVAALGPFAKTVESTSRGVVFGPDGLDDVFAFALHAAAARRWFESRNFGGAHDHVER
jgi:hypothetical protein